MELAVQLTDPIPIASGTGNWGFLLKGQAFSFEDHNWFKTKSDFICYLCLAATEYLTCSDDTSPERKYQIVAASKKIQKLLGPALESSQEGGDDLSEIIDQIGSYIIEIKELIWWGQFQDLVAGRGKVAVGIREEYFSKNGLPRTKEVSNTEDFAAWIYGEFGAQVATGS
jgi:hypothetical protein